MSDSKVVEDTPCCDTGSFMKWWLNPYYGCRANNKQIADEKPVTVVGAGTHTGAGANAFANKEGEKLLFLTYRNCFPKLPNGSTTDSYWGCLVRTGQMVLAQTLMRFYAGGVSIIPDGEAAALRDRVKPLFMDSPRAPLGIHSIEHEAHELGVKYARWLSPTQACLAAFEALNKYHGAGGQSPFPMCCEERNICTPQVRTVLRRGEQVTLMIPVVMGLKKLNVRYQKMLLRCLDMEHVCGIAGGCGKASLYFFGHQGSEVFYLDPHYVQQAYLSDKTAGKMTSKRGKVPVSKIDPCMFIGFLIADEPGFDRFLVELKQMNSFVPFPLISVSDKEPEDNGDEQRQQRQSSTSAESGQGISNRVPAAEYPTEATAPTPGAATTPNPLAHRGVEAEHASRRIDALTPNATNSPARDSQPDRTAAPMYPSE